MKKSGRESLILGGLEHICIILRDFFAESLIIKGLCGLFDSCECRFRTGAFGIISDAETERRSWKYRFRRAILQASEDSALARLSRKIDFSLLNTSMETYGSFGILFGGISAALWFVRDTDAKDMRSLITSLIVLIVSLPLLQSKGSLSHAVRHSILLGSFLFGFCRLSSDRFPSGEQGRDHLWRGFFLALTIGGLSYWVPSFYLLMPALLLMVVKLVLVCPELPILLLICVLPFLNLLKHPTLFLCVGALVCGGIWMKKALSGKRSLRFGLIDLIVSLLALLFLFGGLVGIGGREGLFRGLAYFSVISFWFPASGFFAQSVWRKRAIRGIRLSSLFLGFLGIFQYFFTNIELKWTDMTRFSDIGGRVCGIYSNPNIFAVYLLLSAPFFLMGAADTSKGWNGRILNTAGYFTVLLCTILTWSRGAWLGMLVAFLLFILSDSRRSASLTLLAIPPLSLACLYLPHSVLNRFFSIGQLSESSIRYRLYTWKGVFRMLRAYPFGIGTGDAAFHTVYPQYAVSGTENVMHTHHLLLQVLTELGVFGALIFCILILLLFLMAFHTLRSLHGRRRIQMLGCFCAIVGALTMGMFDYPWYHLGNCFLFFTVAACFGAICIGEDRFLCHSKP